MRFHYWLLAKLICYYAKLEIENKDIIKIVQAVMLTDFNGKKTHDINLY